MFKKYFFTGILAAGALLATSLVQAMPITVSLTLAEDSDPSLVFFEGSATTDNVTAADIMNGYVTVATINFTDVTSALPPGWVDPAGTDAFGDFLNGHFSNVLAYLNAAGTEVIGFTGGGNNGTSQLSLNDVTPATDPLFRWGANNPNFSASGALNNESGIQVIPEPTSIALLGIGLLGLGVAGRKKLVN